MKINVYGITADLPEWAQWLVVQSDGYLIAFEDKPFMHEFPYGGAFWAVARLCQFKNLGPVKDKNITDNWHLSMVSVEEAQFWHGKALEVENAAMFGQAVDAELVPAEGVTVSWPEVPGADGYATFRGSFGQPAPAVNFPSAEEMAGQGVKADSGKPRMDLIPPAALLEVGRVYGYGAQKYAPNNWLKGMDWGRVYAASMRHMLAFWGGEDLDPETGLSHLAHAMFGMMTLFEYQELHPGMDDRPYTVLENLGQP